MMQVGAGIALAGRARAAFLQRAGVVLVPGVAQVDLTARGPGLTRAARAGGQDAIHHVDAAFHRAHDVVRLAHAHQVTRLVGRQKVGRIIKDAEHRPLPFANRKAPHGVAIKADGLQGLRGFLAQFARDAALHDPKEGMARTVAEGIA